MKRFVLILLFVSLKNLTYAASGSGIGPFVGCENDSWYPFKDEKCLHLVNQQLTQDEAQKICTDQSATLVQIHNAEEQEFVRKMLFETYQLVENVWLGATRKVDSESEFVWEDATDSSSILDYTHWAEGSPSNDFGKNCTQLTSHLSFLQGSEKMAENEDGLWADVSCLTKNVVLCQKNQNWSTAEIEAELFKLRSKLSQLRLEHDALEEAHSNLQISHLNLQEEHNQLEAEFDELPELLWPFSCGQVRWREGTKNTIYPFGRLGQPTVVQCDFETDGGGWTVIQRRNSGPLEEFYQDWVTYENGFGSPDKNYWIGLKALHLLTVVKQQELRVELEDWEGNHAHAQYTSFSVTDARDSYRLSIDGYSGDAGDSMMVQNQMRFSTKDRDDDESTASCAINYHGAWWYKNCHSSNLNGYYHPNSTSALIADGINWHTWRPHPYSMKAVEMKIRDWRGK